MIVQLIVLLVVLCIIRSMFSLESKGISYFLSFLLALLFLLQLGSVILTGEIADYRFYENFNFADIFSVADFFRLEGFMIFISLIISTLIINYLGGKIQLKSYRKPLAFVALLFGIVVLGTSGGVLNNVYTTARLKFSGNASFAKSLSQLNINEEQYISKSKIQAIKGKNIIVLSLESLEKGYLAEKLRHLTPNLSQMAQEYTLYSMKQVHGSNWTSASMYTAFTGVPALFSSHGNSIFRNTYDSKLTSLADILNAAGYDIQYFLGKKEYSGVEDMLTSFGVTVKSEKDFDKRYEKVIWGIQDIDLFTEFKNELLHKKQSSQPFALFLSTISTHFPDGVPDKRVDSILPPQKTRLELMASATDYLVGNLMAFLKEEGMLENTVFYIYPDHLLMGNKSRVLEDFDERSLYLLTNASRNTISYPINENIYQIDLPKIILEGAQVVHNVKFLTDFIQDEEKDKFVIKNDKAILQLNEASLRTVNCSEGVYISLNSKKDRFEIKNIEGFTVMEDKLPSKGSCLRIIFDERMRPLEVSQIGAPQLQLNLPKSTFLDIFSVEGILYACLKGKYKFGLTKKSDSKIAFNKADLSLLNDINLDEDTLSSVVLSSNSWNAKKASSFTIKGKTQPITRGLTIISFNSVSEYEFKVYDTYSREEDTANFIETLNTLQKDKAVYIILVHDSAAKALQNPTYLSILRKLGFVKLSMLLDRQAYVMHNLNGHIEEKVDDLTIQMQLSLPKDIKNENLYFTEFIEEKVAFESTIDRYIAHAGGIIGGVKYTNSKEALDYSYDQGFRLFELDIIETSDGALVAAHDWRHWTKETNYLGEVPVTRKEFMKHKVRGTYTPMDMESINKWFEEHPDAILVTDKINDPLKFSEQFADRKRLVMELFSLQAVEKALEIGVTPMVSFEVIGQIKGDVISYLINNKIENIAMTRRAIGTQKNLLKKFRENNIKVFVYQVNFEPGRDEEYVYTNELGVVYGMYADKWIPAFSPKNSPANK